MDHLEPHPHAHVNPAPGQSKRFHIHEMRRIPVTISASAKEVIDGSTRQGRLLPQALSEFFGTLPDVEQVEVDLEEPGDRLMIHVKHAEHAHKHHQFFIEAGAITQVSEQPGKGFDAAMMANELQRLYRTHTLKEGQ